MTVIIDGTNGITNVNGSAAAPAETGIDTDTGIYYGTNTVGLATNGTSALFVDASQNVGIGTSSPGARLAIVGTSGNAQFQAGTTNAVFINAFDSNPIYMTASVTNSTAFGFGAASNIPLFFMTNNTERARIDTSGNLLVGTTSASGAKLNVNGDVQQRGTNGRITQAVKGIGSTVSSITVDVGGGLDGTSYFVEISLSGYNGVYLRYIHTVYKTNSWTDFTPNVVQNLASSGVSVAYSSPSAGVLRYTITASTTYPVVQVKVTSGGTTADPATTISIS